MSTIRTADFTGTTMDDPVLGYTASGQMVVYFRVTVDSGPVMHPLLRVGVSVSGKRALELFQALRRGTQVRCRGPLALAQTAAIFGRADELTLDARSVEILTPSVPG